MRMPKFATMLELARLTSLADIFSQGGDTTHIKRVIGISQILEIETGYDSIAIRCVAQIIKDRANAEKCLIEECSYSLGEYRKDLARHQELAEEHKAKAEV